MSALLEIAGTVSIAAGTLLAVTGSVGLVRLPDFFTRLHGAGVTDTAGTGLIAAGLMLIAGWSLVSLKLGLIVVFVFLTGPVATHALAKAAVHGGLQPLTFGPQEGKSSNP